MIGAHKPMIGAWIAKRRSPVGYEAMNRHDLEAFLKNWVEEATFVYPGEVAASGTYSGKAAIRAWFQRFFEQFPIIRFTVKHVAVADLFDMVGNNVIATHWEVDVTNRDGFEGHNSGVSVVSLRRGKVVHAHDFIFDTGEVFQAAWGEGPSSGARK